MTIPSPRTSREIRSGRMNRRPPSFVVTLVALAIIFALAWTFFLRSASTVPAPVLSGIRGTFCTAARRTGRPAGGRPSAPWARGTREEPSGFRTERWPTVSSRPSQPTMPPRARRASTGVGPSVSYRAIIGVWPPLWQVDTPSPLDYQGLAAMVRSAVEDGDHAVGIKPVKDGGRVAWRAAMTLDGKQIDVVVDQETGIVTWCSFDGEETFTAKVDWASPPAAGTTYSVDVPPGTPGRRSRTTPTPTPPRRRLPGRPPATTRWSRTWRRTASAARRSRRLALSCSPLRWLTATT